MFLRVSVLQPIFFILRHWSWVFGSCDISSFVVVPTPFYNVAVSVVLHLNLFLSFRTNSLLSSEIFNLLASIMSLTILRSLRLARAWLWSHPTLVPCHVQVSVMERYTNCHPEIYSCISLCGNAEHTIMSFMAQKLLNRSTLSFLSPRHRIFPTGPSITSSA